MLKALTDAPGAPGSEYAVREVMDRYIRPLADEVHTDNLGSFYGVKKGDELGPKLLIAGHMDEVAFMVSRITDEGFIKFQTLGGWWGQVMLSQRVTIYTRKGEVVGLIGSKPPHILSPEERKKPVEIKDMFIDVGAADKAEAESFGIRPGDSIIPLTPFTVMKNEKVLMAKAWDNRIGCAIAIEVLKRLKGSQHPNTVYAGATVQEEVGLRGAQTMAHQIQPDLAIAVDVGVAGDTPGVKPDDTQAKMGGGPQLLLYDASMVPHRKFRDFIIDTAEEEKIPYQYDMMSGGGTDAGRFHLAGNGVPSMVVSIPTRYIHSHAALLHRDDFDNSVKLLMAVIKRLDRTKLAEILR
jgi:endoglucanase